MSFLNSSIIYRAPNPDNHAHYISSPFRPIISTDPYRSLNLTVCHFAPRPTYNGEVVLDPFDRCQSKHDSPIRRTPLIGPSRLPPRFLYPARDELETPCDSRFPAAAVDRSVKPSTA